MQSSTVGKQNDLGKDKTNTLYLVVAFRYQWTLPNHLFSFRLGYLFVVMSLVTLMIIIVIFCCWLVYFY